MILLEGASGDFVDDFLSDLEAKIIPERRSVLHNYSPKWAELREGNENHDDFFGDMFHEIVDDLNEDDSSDFIPYELALMQEARREVSRWKYGVESAIERNVGFRLPNELNGYGNCGEKSAVLYACAHKLDLNPQFYVKRDRRNAEVIHPFVLFDFDGTTYIADPEHDVTADFEIGKHKINIGGNKDTHYGIQFLEEGEVDEFIRKLRSDRPMTRLFAGGQIVKWGSREDSPWELFARAHPNGIFSLPRITKAPLLEVIITHDEPYNENTAIQLFYNTAQNTGNPVLIRYYDLTHHRWGRLEGTLLATVSHPGTKFETCTYRHVDDGISEEDLKGMVAYLDYRRKLQKKEDGLKRRAVAGVYLSSHKERDILGKMEEKMKGVEQYSEEWNELLAQHQAWMRKLESGRTAYGRYVDFRVTTLWPYRNERTLAQVLRPHKQKSDWETRLTKEYVEQKHQERMHQILNGASRNLLGTVRRRLYAESQE